MRENVEANIQQWDKYHWPEDGDEWAGQATVCGVPYDEWKASLVRRLIAPNVTSESLVLEIAPGHGRWTEFLVERAAHVILVDVSPSCLDFCRRRFRDRTNVDYYLTTGDILPHLAKGRIDFVWSYDSFVHMDRGVIESYLIEIRRVLKPGGTVTLHHANVDDLANHKQDEHPGWRSAMTAELMKTLAEKAGLTVVDQFLYWDAENKIGVPRYSDRISVLRRP